MLNDNVEIWEKAELTPHPLIRKLYFYLFNVANVVNAGN
jgi:hypothetical protein